MHALPCLTQLTSVHVHMYSGLRIICPPRKGYFGLISVLLFNEINVHLLFTTGLSAYEPESTVYAHMTWRKSSDERREGGEKGLFFVVVVVDPFFEITLENENRSEPLFPRLSRG